MAMPKFTKSALSIVAAGLLLAGLTACTGAKSTDTKSADTSSSAEKPLASIPTLTGVDTAVALDSGFAAALTTLGLTPGVIGGATLTDGSLHFPITGGNVDYYSPTGKVRPYVQGIIEHKDSGFSLTAGDTTVSLTNFTIDPGTSKLFGDVSVNGTSAATQALLFNLYGGTLKPLKMDGNNAILTGTTVHVSAVAAELLNKVFKTTAVESQLLVGVATITVIAK